MDRLLRLVTVAAAATLLVAGVAQAARPPQGTPAGQAWLDPSDGNPIALAAGGGARVVSLLTLPNDTRFVVNATLTVYNTDFDNEALVGCSLRHGVDNGGTALDFAEAHLPAANVNGLGMARIALTGAVDRVGAVAGVNVHVSCGSQLGAIAQFGNLTAISVSSLTTQ